MFDQHYEAILCWAILNGEKVTFNKCINRPQGLQTLTAWRRGGLSIDHMAAMGGSLSFMQYLRENGFCTLAPAKGNITPLHLAVRHRRIELVEWLMVWIDAPWRYGPTVAWFDQYSDPGTEAPKSADSICISSKETPETKEESSVVYAIIHRQDYGHTPISLAASGATEAHRKIERFLWKTLDDRINKSSLFSTPLKEEAKFVLELAAQYETLGEKTCLANFLNSMPRPSSSKAGGMNPLHLAVYHRLLVVVWWVFSNGWYSSGNHIEKAQQVTSKWKNERPVEQIIQEMLENAPPLLKHQYWRYEEHLPSFQFPDQDHNSLVGTVLDFYHKEQPASVQLKRRSMKDIIYGEGPKVS
jgi:hypothetical protein